MARVESRAADADIDYGVDAPGVTRAFLIAGIAGLAVGLGMVALAGSGWARWVGAAVSVAALGPLALAAAMLLYAWRGKRRTRDWLIARHPWRGDETVLDIGAGRGLLTIAAARRAPAGRVIAADIWRHEDLSGNGAGALNRNLERAGVAATVTVSDMDARALALPDASVDVILSLLCLHNIEDAAGRGRACTEIARVLRPGGAAYLADYTGTAAYARALRAAGLAVTGPVGAIPVALSLISLVEARKAAAA